MPAEFLQSLSEQTNALKSQGLFKTERVIAGPQQAAIDVRDDGGVQHVLNLCANNYLGLANHPEVIAAAHKALDEFGYGVASVRFICGTQTLHKDLEERISSFLETEDTILYPSCFDANGGLFETILGPEDAVISDALNHASIIDGVRLCKAQRLRYKHNDVQDLEAQLEAAKDAKVRLIVTDGVFSMDGTIADLQAICDLAKEYDALTMIDDCHATGFLGAHGRGTHEYRDVMGRIDIITGTLGKALGTAGAFVAGSEELIEFLIQKARTYIYTTAMPPALAEATRTSLKLVQSEGWRREHLAQHIKQFRTGAKEIGLTLMESSTPIQPIVVGDSQRAVDISNQLLEKGILVTAIRPPTVPLLGSRLRISLNSFHKENEIAQLLTLLQQIIE